MSSSMLDMYENKELREKLAYLLTVASTQPGEYHANAVLVDRILACFELYGAKDV